MGEFISTRCLFSFQTAGWACNIRSPYFESAEILTQRFFPNCKALVSAMSSAFSAEVIGGRGSASIVS